MRDLIVAKRDLECAFGYDRRDTQKLTLRFPDDDHKQMFNMIRDEMKRGEVKDTYRMVCTTYK